MSNGIVVRASVLDFDARGAKRSTVRNARVRVLNRIVTRRFSSAFLRLPYHLVNGNGDRSTPELRALTRRVDGLVNGRAHFTQAYANGRRQESIGVLCHDALHVVRIIRWVRWSVFTKGAVGCRLLAGGRFPLCPPATILKS